MRVYERLAAVLRTQGVTAVSTLLSEDILPLAVELEERNVTITHTRHESGAIGIAHGYSKAAGTLGVAMVGRGPAFTNSLTLLISAARDRNPAGMLVIVGDAPATRADVGVAQGDLKYMDMARVLEAVDVQHVLLNSAASAGADLEVACQRARAGATVVVGLPIDIVRAEAGDAPSRFGHVPVPPVPAPDKSAIEMVADLLEEGWAAKRPLVLAGRGAIDAAPHLRRLGDMIGALLGTTLLAQSLFRGDAFDIGVIGTVGKPVAQELSAKADLLLVFGASLSPHTTWRGEGSPNARVVHFDVDSRAFGRYLAPDISVCADASLAAKALVGELERRRHAAVGARGPEMAGRIAELWRVEDIARPSASLLDPRVALREIDRMLPSDRLVVLDAGHCTSFSGGFLTVTDPRSFHFPHDFGSIGASLSFATGVAMARPDRLTVYAGGDGSFMMALSELDTVVRTRVPMVLLVINDGGFGAEFQSLVVEGGSGDIARYANPPLEAVARGMGADGLTIRSLADLDTLRATLRKISRPLVVDMLVDPAIQADWVSFFHAASLKRVPVGSNATRA
jgi:thiamine pyrophosphate-dependent acetolactate synthase large subunit-like protein